MKIGLALLVVLCVSCASPTPRAAATPEGGPAPAAAVAATPSSGGQPSVIITTDPHAAMGCRLITHTTAGYDIREPVEWRKLQDETARLGGNTALVSTEGDHRADIYSCAKP